MKKEIENQLFEKMKSKDFGESMCNDTKRKVLKWVINELSRVKITIDNNGGGYVGEALQSLIKFVI